MEELPVGDHILEGLPEEKGKTLLIDLADAELLDEARDVDLPGADRRAAAAADAELVELLELFHPVEKGGQDRPDPARIDMAVDVAADQRVDRADV